MKAKHKPRLYKDWVVIPFQYYALISQAEKAFEFFVPYAVAAGCAFIYCKINRVLSALAKLSDILPTMISLFIGFTVMLITVLLTSGSNNIDQLKKALYKKALNGKNVTLYQALHIQFCHLLLREVLLLLILLFYLFLSGFMPPTWINALFLFGETGMTLSILLALVRSITNLYLSFINPFKDNPQ